VESDPIGINGGTGTYSYADSTPVLSADPTGLCPATFDTGWFRSSATFEPRSQKPGQCDFYQQRWHLTGALAGQTGSCDCGAASMTCIYSVTYESYDRVRPADCKKRIASGDWTQFGNNYSRNWGQYAIPYDCKTKELQTKGVSKLP
jgi:hypothetical protein